MNIADKAEKAKGLIIEQVKELSKIIERAQEDSDFDAAHERLKRWKERTIKLISSEISLHEGDKLQNKRKMSFLMGQPLRNLTDEADMYRGFLYSLIEEIENHPGDVINFTMEVPVTIPQTVEVPQTTGSKSVFIVHGHDELNLLRLEKVMRDKWHIDPIILSSEPSKGRTIIEKFEQEAQRVTYAIVLFTPDDLIEVSGTQYTQARPNVIFELGWFYGRLGRERVCILFKKGTKIHSDLDGIMRIEFNESILEKTNDIETELKDVGLL